MRSEGELRRLAQEERGLLRDLRGVAVLRQPVRTHALVDRPVEEGLIDVVARAGDARLGVDDELVGDEPRPEGGREREKGRRRVAPGIGDEARAADLFAGQLGEPVHRCAQKTRRGVGVAVPPLVQLRVAQPEVAADVDDRAPFVEPPLGQLRRLARRERGEDRLRVLDIGADDERLWRAVQVRLRRPEWLALMRARDGGDQTRLGVAQQQPRELAARVAGDPHDRDPGRHQREIMRRPG